MDWRQLTCVVVLLTAAATAAAKDDERIPVYGAPPAMPPWMYEKTRHHALSPLMSGCDIEMAPVPVWRRIAPAGVWAPREPDWRSIDWSGPGHGHAVHRTTQAHSLNFEQKYVAPAKPSREAWFKIVIHEFIPFDRVCGPGVR